MAQEKNFENQVKKFLQSRAIYPMGTPKSKMFYGDACGYYEKRWGGGFTKSGLPDLSICVYGFTVEVELKAENGHPSEIQKFMLNQIRQSKSFGILLYPKDFETFVGFIGRLLLIGERYEATLHNRIENEYPELLKGGI